MAVKLKERFKGSDLECIEVQSTVNVIALNVSIRLENEMILIIHYRVIMLHLTPSRLWSSSVLQAFRELHVFHRTVYEMELVASYHERISQTGHFLGLCFRMELILSCGEDTWADTDARDS